jgi:heterodisulfide reductase subunit A-like polyferredoxin
MLWKEPMSATKLFEQIQMYHPHQFGNVFNHMARKLGFDGMIVNAKGYFPKMPGVTDDTYHFVAFAGDQIKSAYHKGKKQTGLFSPDSNIYRAAPIVGAGAAGAAATMEEDEEL